jgi:hypothetical protein
MLGIGSGYARREGGTRNKVSPLQIKQIALCDIFASRIRTICNMENLASRPPCNCTAFNRRICFPKSGEVHSFQPGICISTRRKTGGGHQLCLFRSIAFHPHREMEPEKFPNWDGWTISFAFEEMSRNHGTQGVRGRESFPPGVCCDIWRRQINAINLDNYSKRVVSLLGHLRHVI